MTTQEQLNKQMINQIIGKCLDEIKEKTGIVLDAKVNGRIISVYLDDPDQLHISDLSIVKKAVVDALGEGYGEDMLTKKNKEREYVDARMIFSYISKQYDFTFQAIGKYLERDHTTVLHHVRKAKHLLEYDSVFITKYNKVIETLNLSCGKAVY